jgi:photosystem II stability/assembly factor-like uncharacterized protein
MQRTSAWRRALVAAAICCAAMVWTPAALGAPVSVGYSGWAWSEPAPQGETLDRVAFQGATGYAAGGGGAVLRSNDAGLTWTGLPSGTEQELTLLDEVDPATVVVGGGCVVRESTDGGASFRRLAVNASETECPTKVASLSFVSASTGFVEQADGSVLFTSDGGQSVEQRTAVPLAGGSPVQIYFRTPSLGFAVVNGPSGGRIYRTTDGAGSWTQVGAAGENEPLYEIDFASAGVAYAVGGGQPPTSKGPPARNGTLVLVSEDGGATWEERKAASEPKSIKLPAGTPPLALRQIDCSDPLHCLLTTGSSSLVLTSDGTVTGSLVTPSEGGLSSLAFSTGTTVVAVGAGGTIVRSTDGGATFTAISRRLGIEPSGIPQLGAGPKDAYLAGQAGAIAATADGGGEWRVLHVPTSADLAGLAFPSPLVGYAVDSRGTVFRTLNGGASWAIQGGAGEAPAYVLAHGTGTVLLVGPTGLRRSTDGGVTFAPVGGTVVVGRRHNRPVRRALSAFPLFAGARNAGQAIVAWGDQAIESVDGGAQWTLIPAPLHGASVEAVSFLSATVGYEVSRQRLFFTRNAGRSWQEIASLGSQALGGEASLSFSSVADGYAVARFDGRDRFVMRTSDGGRSWTPQLLPRAVEAVAAAGGEDYLTGGHEIFVTSTGGLAPSASKLTLSLSGPQRITRARLRNAHGRVGLRGRLSPAQGGEAVIVSHRERGRSVWVHQRVTVASNGSFALTVSGVSSTTDFVAQWGGEGALAGAGTPAVTVTVVGKRR